MEYTVPGLEQVDLILDRETLEQPLHWRQPRYIFPCSMTDWMADFVPDAWRISMFDIMSRTPQHTYLALTKRADNQRASVKNLGEQIGSRNIPGTWPLPNLWLGVSAENQKYADLRVPELEDTPAAVRWVSAEPLLDGIDFSRYRKLDWVVVGRESGKGARLSDIGAIRSIVKQGRDNGFPVYVKQLGTCPGLKDRKGENPAEWPRDLRVREYPKVDHGKTVYQS